jgi:hypothetical protein
MSLAERAAARREQRAQEMAKGRQVTKAHMANGLLDQLASEFSMPRTWFTLNNESEDVRNWTISVTLPGADPVTESFFEFPSPDFRAMVALMKS